MYAEPSFSGVPVAPQPTPRRTNRFLRTVSMTLAAAGLALGSGLTGAVAAVQMVPQQAPPTAIVAQTQPVRATTVANSVYQKVGDSVVQVVTSVSSRGRLVQAGTGSGFVIDNQGHILTNQHVINGGAAFQVKFAGGETRTAQLVGFDSTYDLAILKVDLPAGVQPVAFGDSGQVQVGELAIAIGSPFGLDQTVTQGIISSSARTVQMTSRGPTRTFLQTDTPINPGNSGGPLLNADAQVIGINTMIESPVQGSVGVGFAIPSNVAQELIPQLLAGLRR